MQGNFQGKPIKESRKRAVTPQYVSPNQLTFCGFETPFEQKLSTGNRWIKLSAVIPWDRIVRQYDQLFNSNEGRPPINGRIVIGSVIIKHMLNLTDRETMLQIRENMFMQYFIGYSTFTNEEPFSHTLFGTIRNRLSLNIMNVINEILIAHCNELRGEDMPTQSVDKMDEPLPPEDKPTDTAVPVEESHLLVEESVLDSEVPAEQPAAPLNNQGRLLMDATVAPQRITFPTDLKLLNAAREKTEQLIDKLYDNSIHESKPRTYRQIARKEFLNTARKKSKTYKEIYCANGSQIRYLKRNLGSIDQMITAYKATGDFVSIPLEKRDYEYIETLKLVHEQQQLMHETRTNRIDNRIVNIHQSHVRPIKRGKDGKKVEFGSKMQVSLVNGFMLIDKLSWDNFNEGITLMESVNLYKARFGFYPKEVLADQIYCNRANRKSLKELNINLKAKPLGRPTTQPALSNQVRPGERNPIEGKFGQAKVAYGLDSIGAKLKSTSESWIASISLVLNLMNLMRLAPSCLYQRLRQFYICFFDSPKMNFQFMSKP